MKQKKLSKNFFVPKNNYEQVSLNVYNLLVDNFSETYFVGGMVRNLLLDKKITDIDIATVATPQQVIKLLDTGGWDYDQSAQSFGVITVGAGKLKVEITTLREEAYNNSRYPKVTFTKSLKLDSERRDFSINSLYFNAKKHVITDFQNGLQDLRKKQLNSVGDANKKFQEDPLRIVRAIRFQKQYQLQFGNETELAIANNFHLVKSLSKNKILDEIQKVKSQAIKNFLTKKFL